METTNASWPVCLPCFAIATGSGTKPAIHVDRTCCCCCRTCHAAAGKANAWEASSPTCHVVIGSAIAIGSANGIGHHESATEILPCERSEGSVIARNACDGRRHHHCHHHHHCQSPPMRTRMKRRRTKRTQQACGHHELLAVGSANAVLVRTMTPPVDHREEEEGNRDGYGPNRHDDDGGPRERKWSEVCASTDPRRTGIGTSHWRLGEVA